MRARTLTCVVAFTLASAAPQTQSADELMSRVGDWVHRFAESFANVVAEETFVPTRFYNRPGLRSDYLLVQYPGSDDRWLTFRDVVAVNGQSLQNHPERLARLFLEPFESAVRQADAIKTHSARYISPVSDPLMGLVLLQRRYQPRFQYSLGDLDRRRGVRRIGFEEMRSPTILRQDGDRDLPTRGSAWVVEATGQVLRTAVEIGTVQRLVRRSLLETVFTFDRALQMDVPASMRVSWMQDDESGVLGNAYYTRFRRFAVRTSEVIKTPAH